MTTWIRRAARAAGMVACLGIVSSCGGGAPMGPPPGGIPGLLGTTLVRADGREVPVASLAGKTVGLYFSASWCGPCQVFTPDLVTAYREITGAGHPFEIVLVSSDVSPDDMFAYMRDKEMPWLAVPFDRSTSRTLGSRYGVRGIPSLVVLAPDGSTVTVQGREAVARQGARAWDGWKP